MEGKSLDLLQEKIEYRFRDFGLLRHALIHSSYINETNAAYEDCNERLEFLGDAVLELISSRFLFENYPHSTEGELTRLRASLVCEPTLAMDAAAIDLGSYLILGKGEDRTGGRKRDSITSDALEALLGAIYLDGGMEPAAEFAKRFILNDISNKKLFHDSKTILQEYVQEKPGRVLEYRIVGTTGPEHDRTFLAEADICGRVVGSGSGHTKKAAEQMAAYQALINLRKGTEENECI